MQCGVALVWLAVFLSASLPGSADDLFEIELHQLRGQRIQDVGRATLVAAYEKFIEDHLADPRIAEVMIETGSYCENDGSAFGRQKGLRWHEAAAAKANVGSKVWIKAQFLVAARVNDRERSFEILDTIAENCKNDPVVLIRIEGSRLVECIRTRDLAEAENHCLKLLDWCADPKNQASDPRANLAINSERLTARFLMIQTWITAPWPKDERKRKLREFQNRYPVWSGPQPSDVESAISRIDTGP